MGKKKIQVVDDSQETKKPVKEPLTETVVEETVSETETPKKEKAKRKAKIRGRRYQKAFKKVDRKKTYPIAEAIKLLKETSLSRFNGSVEAHIVTRETGIKGEISFPHATGKTIKIAIASEDLLKEIEKGKMDFNILLATPEMMPKLAKYAKTLGPKGLMPSPKAGSVTSDPQKTAKEMAGKVAYKTETKAPLVHIVIGKISDKDEDLTENFTALVTAIGLSKTVKAVISSTMGPGIKVDLAS